MTGLARRLGAYHSVLLRGPDYFRQLVRRHESGATRATGTRRLLIYAHYSPSNTIEPYVVACLKAWAALDVPVVFVSTNPDLPQRDIEAVLPHVRTLVLRENVGYDFGSYKTGLELATDRESFDYVLLLNSSVYGPVAPLAPFLQLAEQSQYDLTGATDSYEIAYHAQSYFFSMRRDFVRSPFFKRYWKHLPLVSDRRLVIDLFELGYTREALAAGHSVGAVYDCWSLMQRELHADCAPVDRKAWLTHWLLQRKNPTLILWPTLVRELAFPFIKIELIRDNPFNDPAWPLWSDIVGERSPEWATLINEHLKRPSAAAPLPAPHRTWLSTLASRRWRKKTAS